MCDKARIGRSGKEEIYKTLSQVEAKTAMNVNEDRAMKYIAREEKKKRYTHGWSSGFKDLVQGRKIVYRRLIKPLNAANSTNTPSLVKDSMLKIFLFIFFSSRSFFIYFFWLPDNLQISLFIRWLQAVAWWLLVVSPCARVSSQNFNYKTFKLG